MSLKLSNAKSGTDFVRAEPGTHMARCYAVVDLGTHTEDTKFGRKTNRKIQVSWELPEETHVFDEGKGAQPLSVHKRYNFVMGKKATFQIDLESWRARPFTSEELENFEIQNLVGKPCVLNLAENESNGRTYTNVKSVSPPIKGQSVKPAVNTPVYYDVSMGRNDTYQGLPEFLQNYIAECEEWNQDADPDTNFLGGIDKPDGDLVLAGAVDEGDTSLPF